MIGTEPDGGKVRFVLPPGDPCSCTELILGGHNAYAQPRNEPPVYIDTLPMDAEGLRRELGCTLISKGMQHAVGLYVIAFSVCTLFFVGPGTKKLLLNHWYTSLNIQHCCDWSLSNVLISQEIC